MSSFWLADWLKTICCSESPLWHTIWETWHQLIESFRTPEILLLVLTHISVFRQFRLNKWEKAFERKVNIFMKEMEQYYWFSSLVFVAIQSSTCNGPALVIFVKKKVVKDLYIPFQLNCCCYWFGPEVTKTSAVEALLPRFQINAIIIFIFPRF